jgi:putative SOS response-associated peptidase YedK
MTSKRLCFEPGHKPKCLVIVDDTAEWDRAVYYASRWAIRAGGGVVMLRIIEPEQQSQEWLGVADIMRAEAHEAAEAALDRAAGRANAGDGHFRRAQRPERGFAVLDCCSFASPR